MDSIEEFVDERQKGWCVHCGGWIAELESNRDHVPTKGLLHKPYPANLPVIPVCRSCNLGFSRDEEYLIAFLGAVLTGTTEPEKQASASAARIFSRNCKLRARIERSKKEYETAGVESRVLWMPEPERVNRVIIKNARGHAYFEFGEPMLGEPDHVWTAPLEAMTAWQWEEFEDANPGPFWPEVGSRLMTRVVTGQDLLGAWVIVQGGTYRYAVAQHGIMRVRMVLHEYLAAEVSWEG